MILTRRVNEGSVPHLRFGFCGMHLPPGRARRALRLNKNGGLRVPPLLDARITARSIELRVLYLDSMNERARRLSYRQPRLN